jgi:hypothetical protein
MGKYLITLAKISFVFVIVCISTLLTNAQLIKLSTSPEAYIKDLEKLCKEPKNPKSVENFNRFNTFFSSKTEQQTDIIALSQLMSSKGYKSTEFSLFIELLANIDPKISDQTQISKLLKGLNESVKNQSFKVNIELLNSLNLFFKTNQIYTSNFNKLYVLDFEIGDIQYYNKKTVPFTTTPLADAQEKIQEESQDLGFFDDFGKDEKVLDAWDDPNLEIKGNPSQKLIQIPNLNGFVLKFEKINLAIVSPSDSFLIQNTQGYVDWNSGNFTGKSGQVNFSNVGIQDAIIKLDLYSFKIKSPQLKAEEVTLDFPEKLLNPIKGVLEFKGEKRPAGQISKYPRFKSYSNDAQVLFAEHDIKYKGGFSLIGNRFYSNSLFNNLSKLQINSKSTFSFEVEGTSFEFSDSTINSNLVSFVTHLDKDSISHPAINMSYDLQNKLLKLKKVESGGFRNSFYSDTFHQIEVMCDALRWDLNSGKMDFYIISGKSEIPAVFESFNYYNPDRVRTLSTNAGFNSLITAGNLVGKKKINEFTAEEIQSIVKKDLFIVKNGLLIANQMGFFDYNPHKNSYRLSRKGIHYFKSFAGQSDYDDLVLTSISKDGNTSGNASIDLKSKSLDIQGAQDFKLSDSLGVRFLPKNQEMKIVGNKIFNFEGQIIIKNFRFVGDFTVEYENFLVKLNRLDSIKFIPLAIYKKGGKLEMGNQFKFDSLGTIYLNSPDNKSGRKKLPEYPKLVISKGATALFNIKTYGNNKYPETVNFKIPSINLDSLNTIDPRFDGTFYSGGIFKPIKETLEIMPDTSIGFYHKPILPYNIYNSETTFKFDSELTLNKKGLSSSGELNHLAAKILTKATTFRIDTLQAKGESGKISEANFENKSYFPAVDIKDYALTWKPVQDSMLISSKEGFKFYKASSTLKGSLIVRKTGLYGSGTLEREDSETKTLSFKFNKTGFDASKSQFKIKSVDQNTKPILFGKNVDLNFNVLTGSSTISPLNADVLDTLTSSIEFPLAAYKTTIDKATWSIKDKKISMVGNVENSTFTATNPNQYGLFFNGSSALYDISQNTLNINGVPSIKSVDALIVPYKGSIIIKNEGVIEQLTNAKVIADTINNYHTLTQANIKIISKKAFTGDANYQFVNVKSDTFNIKMGNFEFNEIDKEGNIGSSKKSNKLSTIARAKVSEKDSVFLSPKMLYRGEIIMLAPFKNLSLNGSVIPDLKKYPMLGGNWVNYKGNKSEEISINIDNTLKDGGKPLYVGLHLKESMGTDALYPTFLSAKKYEADLDVFKVEGILKRDEPNKRFVVGPEEEKNKSEGKNRFEFYDNKGLIAMEGRFNLLNSNDDKYLETIGIGNLKLDSMQYSFSTLVKYNFPIPIPLTAKIGESIVKANLDAGNSESAISTDSEFFMAKISHLLGDKDANEYRNKAMREHIPLYKFSSKFLTTMVISDLDLKWNPVRNSFYSKGKIGVSNIGEVDINAQMDGYFEVLKSPQTGDEVNMFFEPSPNSWYYFGYRNGQLGIASSDNDLVKLITPAENAKNKSFQVVLIDAAEALQFRKKFQQIYLGQKENISSKKNTEVKKASEVSAKPGVKKEEKKKVDEQEGF